MRSRWKLAPLTSRYIRAAARSCRGPICTPVHVSLGGDRVRIEISNMLNAQPLEIGSAHIAVYKGGGAIVSGTDRPLTFSGGADFTVPPGALGVSDPVNLGVAPMSDLAVSLYLPHD